MEVHDMSEGFQRAFHYSTIDKERPLKNFEHQKCITRATSQEWSKVMTETIKNSLKFFHDIAF